MLGVVAVLLPVAFFDFLLLGCPILGISDAYFVTAKSRCLYVGLPVFRIRVRTNCIPIHILQTHTPRELI
jgi:hypothetical protein